MIVLYEVFAANGEMIGSYGRGQFGSALDLYRRLGVGAIVDMVIRRDGSQDDERERLLPNPTL